MASDLLGEHTIARMETLQVAARYPRLIGRNARRGIHGWGPTAAVVVLETDAGVVGWGAARRNLVNPAEIVGKRVSELISVDAGVLAPCAESLDLALHDLAGVILEQPVHEMLGCREGTRVLCYDGAIYMDDLLPEDNPGGMDAVLANCTADYEQGYRAFKLKIGRGYRWMDLSDGLRRDIELTRRVRQDCPEAQILVDANDGYTCDGFLQYLDAVVDCGLYWIEEPFVETRDDLQRLREFLAKRCPSVLVADGEREPDVPFLLELAREGLIDVLIMDIMGYGFTAWRRLMPRVIEAGACGSPHAWGHPLKTYYAAQLAAGLGNVPVVEGVPGVMVGVECTGYRLSDGRLHLPQEPGFGMGLGPG